MTGKGGAQDKDERVNVRIRPEMEKWLKARVADETFGSTSHGIRFCISRMMKEDGK